MYLKSYTRKTQQDLSLSKPLLYIAARYRAAFQEMAEAPVKTRSSPSSFAEDLSASFVGDQLVINTKQKATRYPHRLTNDNICLSSLKEHLPTALTSPCLSSAPCCSYNQQEYKLVAKGERGGTPSPTLPPPSLSHNLQLNLTQLLISGQALGSFPAYCRYLFLLILHIQAWMGAEKLFCRLRVQARLHMN